jgi:hypothetical protein
MVFGLLEVVLFIGGFIGVLLFLYHFVFSRLRKEKMGLILRVLLFEQVGKDIVFLRECRGEEVPDKKLGVYIKIKSERKAISDVANEDLIYDRRLGKCLLVCKYADDDYRVMSRLKRDLWFKKVMVEREKLGVDGEPDFMEVPNELGHLVRVPIMEEVEELVSYVDPIGIGQTGREVARFNREYHKRMEERRAEKAGFWDKYGQMIMIGAFLIIILLSTAYNANKWEMATDKMSAAWGERADQALDKMDNPSWIEKIVRSIDQREANANAPPS